MSQVAWDGAALEKAFGGAVRSLLGHLFPFTWELYPILGHCRRGTMNVPMPSTTLVDPDPVIDFLPSPLTYSSLQTCLETWSLGWPCFAVTALHVCLGTARVCPCWGHCPACRLVTALASPARSAPDNANLLTWEPALWWGVSFW